MEYYSAIKMEKNIQIKTASLENHIFDFYGGKCIL